MIKKINRLLNVVMGAITGVFIGYVIFTCFCWWKYPRMYAMQSAPWYTGILVYGLFTVIILMVCFVVKLILKIIEKRRK